MIIGSHSYSSLKYIDDFGGMLDNVFVYTCSLSDIVVC